MWRERLTSPRLTRRAEARLFWIVAILSGAAVYFLAG